AQIEVSLLIKHGIVRIGMGLIAFRQQHRGTQINRLSPELAQQLALYLDALYILGIARRQWRGNFVIKVESDFITGDGVKMEMADLSKEISRRRVEMLAFPLVHVRPDGMSVRPLETRIN